MRTQSELMHEMVCETHTLFSPDFVDEINAAFKTSIKPRAYRPNPRDPKGLTTHSGKPEVGLACFELAPMLCAALGIKYESKLGRGFQVRACVEALKAAGYGK